MRKVTAPDAPEMHSSVVRHIDGHRRTAPWLSDTVSILVIGSPVAGNIDRRIETNPRLDRMVRSAGRRSAVELAWRIIAPAVASCGIARAAYIRTPAKPALFSERAFTSIGFPSPKRL